MAAAARARRAARRAWRWAAGLASGRRRSVACTWETRGRSRAPCAGRGMRRRRGRRRSNARTACLARMRETRVRQWGRDERCAARVQSAARGVCERVRGVVRTECELMVRYAQLSQRAHRHLPKKGRWGSNRERWGGRWCGQGADLANVGDGGGRVALVRAHASACSDDDGVPLRVQRAAYRDVLVHGAARGVVPRHLKATKRRHGD